MIRIIIGTFLLLILSASTISAQLKEQAKIDSLLKELTRQKEDTNKVNVLCALSRESSGTNPGKAIKYGQDGLDLATNLRWKKGMALANRVLGGYYLRMKALDKALDFCRTALKISEAIGDKDGVAKTTGNIGITYIDQGDYANGIAYFDKAVKTYEEIKDKENVARFTYHLASAYLEQSNYPKALEYYQKVLKIHEEKGDRQQMANIIISIGIVYNSQSDFPKALEYYQKALKIHEAVGNKDGVAAATCNMGKVYENQGNHAKALELFFSALKLDEEIGNKRYAAIVTGNIGTIYGLENDWHKALEYYLKSLNAHEVLMDKYNIAFTTLSVGNAYTNLHDNAKALEYLYKSLNLNENIGNKGGVASSAGLIGDVYMNQGNNTMAIEYLQYSLKLAEEVNDRTLMAGNLSSIGNVYLNIMKGTPVKAAKQDKVTGYDEQPPGKYKATPAIPTGKAALLRAAISYMERAILIAKEINNPDLIRECYEHLATAYTLNGDYKKALAASDNFHAIKDSVFSKENKEKIIKMGMQDEYSRKRLTDSLKTIEKEKITAIQLDKQKNYTYLGITGILLLACFSFFIVKERSKSERERKKSDELLLNILPTDVAKELKAHGVTTARHYDNVTVLFTDFVNFTEAGERMDAQRLIDELHNCFKAFDEITAKYNIEKIKTIGDAYLAVCGLPSPDPKHAENVVRAAVEINTFMANRLAHMGSERTFAIRIGIHSGSVVAGIVGVKKFAYDIWGDTVNTAARMEQHGEAGKINISHTTYERVKNKLICEYRGEVEAKGKGVMRMYFVQ